jgi:hypothetical protein
MACFNADPTEADTFVLVNNVVPVLASTLTSENTLIESSPKTYKKLLAERILVILVRSVESVMVKNPAETL